MHNGNIAALLITILLMGNAIGIAFFEQTILLPVQAQPPANGLAKDVLFIEDARKYAYFGWYKPSQMTAQNETEEGWDLLNRTVIWATSYRFPNETNVVLFTQDGTLDPGTDLEGKTIYDRLVGGEYNVTVHSQADVETISSTYYDVMNFHLAIYAVNYLRSASNVIASGIPFITFSAGQTDEMGIGTGIVTMSNMSTIFFVVSDNYYPTYFYPKGPLGIFGEEVSFEATEAVGDAKVLVTSEIVPVSDFLEMSVTQNITVSAEGNAQSSLRLEIPQSSLADTYRDMFFSNTSSLMQGIEYDIPESRDISYEYTVEPGVTVTSLAGDINGDGKVDREADLAFIAGLFGAEVGNPDYDLAADITGPTPFTADGKINMRDIAVTARNLGMTLENTGNLYVTGYYNGSAVNCTDVYYVGPLASTTVNVSDVGYPWNNIATGVYSIYGTYQTFQASTTVDVTAQNTTYAQLDFGGDLPPPAPQTGQPVKNMFYDGIAMDQLASLGFNTTVTESTIVPLGLNNETIISLNATAYNVASPIDVSVWRLPIGPRDENGTNTTFESMAFKISMIQEMLRSLPGDQKYSSSSQTRIELPPGATLLNVSVPIGTEWQVDFDYYGDTYVWAGISGSDSQGLYLNETIVVTERLGWLPDDTLNATFSTYKKFFIDYNYSTQQVQNTIQAQSKTIRLTYLKNPPGWEFVIRLVIQPFRKASVTLADANLNVEIAVEPTLTFRFYMGTRQTWWGRYDLFLASLTVTPEVKVTCHVTAQLVKEFIKSREIGGCAFTYWFFPYGWPVMTKLRTTITGRVIVKAYAKLGMTVGVKAYASFSAGVVWKRGEGWSPRKSIRTGCDLFGPTFSGSVGLTVTPEAQCRIAFLLYDVAGPFIQGVPYAPMNLEYDIITGTLSGFISLKIRVDVGCTLSNWLKNLLGGVQEYSQTVLDVELKSWPFPR